jgi:hypothetical protein
MGYDKLKPEQVYDILDYLPTVTKTITLDLDGSGEPLTTGLKGYITFPYAAEITGWYIVADTTGSCQLDIWRSNAIPDAGDSITGVIKPYLDNEQFRGGSNLTGWFTGIVQNDIIAFNLISVNTITKLNLVLKLNLI